MDAAGARIEEGVLVRGPLIEHAGNRTSVRGVIIGGRDGRAFAHAIVGGFASLIAAACFAGAFILALLSQTPST